jgi:hypothetical protein
MMLSLSVAAPVALQSQSLGGDFRNTTIHIDKRIKGDRDMGIQDSGGKRAATGGVTVEGGEDVAFDGRGSLKTNIAGFWKAIGAAKYRVLFRDPNGDGLILVEVQGEVRWGPDRNVIKGEQNFLRLTTKSINEFVEITKREIKDGKLVVTAKNGSIYTLYKLSCDFSGTGLLVQAAH